MDSLNASLSATWQPFILVAGLLLVGHAASRDGLFDTLGSLSARLPGRGVSLFVTTMLMVAMVSAVLNLDSAVVFMTPVALKAARAKGADETAFVYGTVFMSNSASLLFIGSNLTNILVIGNSTTSPAHFSARMLAPWLLAVVVVIGVMLLWRGRFLRAPLQRAASAPSGFTLGPGIFATIFAVVAMLAARHPALMIFAAGVTAEGWDLVRQRGKEWRSTLAVINPAVLATLFGVALFVGVLARHWTGPARLLAHANVATTTLVATLSALVINNLPAASLFAAHPVAHPYALLLGLDVGPNCLISGALSSLLWRRIVQRDGAQVSLRTLSLIGVLLALATFAVALPVLN